MTTQGRNYRLAVSSFKGTRWVGLPQLSSVGVAQREISSAGEEGEGQSASINYTRAQLTPCKRREALTDGHVFAELVYGIGGAQPRSRFPTSTYTTATTTDLHEPRVASANA